MFVKFLIFAGMIFTAGPLHNEGGAVAVKDDGLKTAVVKAADEADASTLRGNYGNE